MPLPLFMVAEFLYDNVGDNPTFELYLQELVTVAQKLKNVNNLEQSYMDLMPQSCISKTRELLNSHVGRANWYRNSHLLWRIEYNRPKIENHTIGSLRSILNICPAFKTPRFVKHAGLCFWFLIIYCNLNSFRVSVWEFSRYLVCNSALILSSPVKRLGETFCWLMPNPKPERPTKIHSVHGLHWRILAFFSVLVLID